MYGPIIYFFLFGLAIVMLFISVAIMVIETDKKTTINLNKSAFIFVVCIMLYSVINFSLLGMLDSEYNVHDYLLEQFNCEYNIEENEKCVLQFDVVKKE